MTEQPSILGFSPPSKVFADQETVIRVRTPAGDLAWMVTGHAEIRKLAVDGRIGRTHPDSENAPRYSRIRCSSCGAAPISRASTVEILGELVGMPEEDNITFAALMGHIFDAVGAPPLGGGAGDPLFGYLRELAARKRAEPDDDVLSGLARGETPTSSYQMANFDERVFPAPDEVDITRSPNPHLTFSYGM